MDAIMGWIYLHKIHILKSKPNMIVFEVKSLGGLDEVRTMD
jgi:hypothetical protein